jgi:flagellar hook assembly protein FlgD
LPDAVLRVSNYPNPFNEYTLIGFTVASSEAYKRVELDVYDVQGRRIRRLLSQELSAGNYTIRWDGHLEAGGAAPSGVYFSRLRVGERRTASTMILVR